MPRKHFLVERCTCRFPSCTAALLAASVAAFYGAELATPYRSGAGSTTAWYTAVSYALCHNSEYHLWANASVFAAAGFLLEATEGALRTALAVAVSTPAAAMGHALFTSRGVQGASGYVYGVITYQVGLLLKNWREMRVRPSARGFVFVRSVASSAQARLVAATCLLLTEIVAAEYSTNVSHGGHAFGAIAGLLMGLAVGSNVTQDVEELIMPYLGATGLFALAVVGFATTQPACALFIAACLPAVAHAIAQETARWWAAWRVRIGPFGLRIDRR